MTAEKIRLIMYWGGVVLFLLLELRFSYRDPSVSKLRRWVANIPLSIVNGVAYHLMFAATIIVFLSNAESMQRGLLQSYPMPLWLQVVLGILILDFVIYTWHLLNHVVPLFWRFHRVHHCDMNMDVSTASRFHLGELLISGLLRLATIYVFGIPLLAYVLFEIFVNISIQFHHSSIKVNPVFEKYFVLFFVPPFLHRIHHSVKIKERDSNYGVIFSIWDRFLGTLVTKTDQDSILIGIGSHRKFDKLGFWHLMLMPFTKKSI